MTNTSFFPALLIAAFGLCCSFPSVAHESHDESYEGEAGDMTFVNILGEGDNWLKLIERFGGRVRSASRYPNNANGFAQYMAESGVTAYDPIEIITPGTPDLAKKCGVTYLLPPQTSWARSVAMALWATKMIPIAGEKPAIISWYREPCYNKGVGGVANSDHASARAMDLDFSNSISRRNVQKWLCQFWDSSLNMQIGLGGSVIHLGSQSPKGKRNWYYETYADSDLGKTCFD